MKPVGVFRAAPTEGPAYFATYLERRSIPWQLVALDAGAPVPRDVRKFSGLAFMGGTRLLQHDDLWERGPVEQFEWVWAYPRR